MSVAVECGEFNGLEGGPSLQIESLNVSFSRDLEQCVVVVEQVFPWSRDKGECGGDCAAGELGAGSFDGEVVRAGSNVREEASARGG